MTIELDDGTKVCIIIFIEKQYVTRRRKVILGYNFLKNLTPAAMELQF